MEKIEKFKNEYNLITTLVASWKDFCSLQFKPEEHNPDIANSIDYYKLVKQFNELYIRFKKEFESLPDLGFGPLTFIDFKSHNGFRILKVVIEDPENEKFERLIRFVEVDRKLSYSFTKGNVDVIDKEFSKKRKINEDVIKKYLDLASKYELLLDCYSQLRRGFIYGDGTTVLFSNIEGEIFDNLTTFKISCGNLFFNREDFIEAIFTLGKDFKIDYENKKIVIGDDNFNENSILDELMNGLYVHRSKLPKMYSLESEMKLAKEFKSHEE